MTANNVKFVCTAVWGNHRIITHELPDDLNIRFASVQFIITDDLGMRYITAKFVQKGAPADEKGAWASVAQDILEQCLEYK